MPRKIKVVDVDAPANLDDNVKVDESNINQVVVSVDVPEIAHNEPEKVKKTRAHRAKKETVKPIDDKGRASAYPLPVQLEVIDESPKVEVELPKIEEPKKNIKTVELVECPNCHKKLTERTLKYSHQAVCPANSPPQVSRSKEITSPLQQPKPKSRAKATAQVEEQGQPFCTSNY